MIQFQNDYIDRQNRQYDKGKWIKAVIVTESPGVLKYWADHEEPITFQGQTYVPLAQHWDRIRTSGTMSVEGAEIALSNIGNQVIKYIKDTGEAASGDITGNFVVMQLLHLDLLATLTNFWKRKLKIIAVRADINAALFTLSRELGQNRLPRRLILPEGQG